MPKQNGIKQKKIIKREHEHEKEIDLDPKCLNRSFTFDWNVQKNCFEENFNYSSDSDIECETQSKPKKQKLTKEEKKEIQRLEEAKLREAEEALLNSELNPKTPDQFSRLLLGQPNNSALWIQYMSYHIEAAEFEKAKSVGYLALKTINPKEEQEKLNVWVALLNFENLYGTKESLKECFDEAVRMNDDYKVYSKMLEIFSASRKSKDVDNLVNKMCRKYKDNIDCWLICAKSLFSVNLSGKAKFFLQRALECLPKKEHITMISRFALLENQMGFSEDAQTLFEHTLTAYPARVDVWNCYIDMLVKSNMTDLARKVLERACSQKLPPRKMKSLYTKWLSFEEAYGNQQTVKSVKEEAAKYVNRISKLRDTSFS